MSDPYLKPAAVCADGLSSGSFEERSAKKAGKPIDEWRKNVADSLANAKEGDLTSRKIKDPDTGKMVDRPLSAEEAQRISALGKAIKSGEVKYDSSSLLDQLHAGQVKGFEDFSSYRGRQWPMFAYLNKRGLAYESAWQPTTTISFVEKVPDGVDKAGKPKTKDVTHYVDAGKIPYVVRRKGFTPPLGSYVKVTDPATGKSTIARVLEGGPMDKDAELLNEASLKVYDNLGYDVDPETGAGAPKNLQYDVISQPGAGQFDRTFDQGYLNNAETQLAGSMVSSSSYIGTRQGLYDAMVAKYGANARAEAAKKGVDFPADMKTSAERAAEKAAEQKQKSGGPKVMKGAKTVFVGEKLNQLAINNPNTICEAGGYVNAGSSTVFAEQCAVSRELDGTSEQWRIAEGSGVPHVLVG